jgi:hypothetical protein
MTPLRSRCSLLACEPLPWHAVTVTLYVQGDRAEADAVADRLVGAVQGWDTAGVKVSRVNGPPEPVEGL